MNPLASALKSRRGASNPMPEMQPQGEEGQSKVASILASLTPEEKSEMMSTLQMEMGEESQGEEMSEEPQGKLETKDGETKQTVGEKQALSEEASNSSQEAADALGDSRFKAGDTSKPRNLGERVKMNIANMMKK